jgi:hypothetical protein
VTAGTVVERANPRSLPQPATLICAGLAALGTIAFLAGLAVDAPTAWRAFHVNFVYFAGLSQGGLVLAAVFVIVGAHWPGPVRRIAEGLAAWAPVSLVLGSLGYFGREHLFEWIHHPVGKEGWLDVGRVYATDIAIYAVFALLALVFLRASTRPIMQSGIAQGGPGKPWFERFGGGWRGDAQERAAAASRIHTLAPIVCLVYAIGFTMVAFDQVMSMEPTWYSNLFGAYVSWGGFLSAVAATALISVLLRNHPGLEGEITTARMHDLGKMIFAFSVFWMYLFWSQYLPIWYGNLPEETQYFETRLGPQFLQDTWDFVSSRVTEHPYARLTLLVWACCWITPFWVLLGQRPKKTPVILGGVALVVLVGFWLERNVLVWPSVLPQDGSAWLGWIQLGTAAGFTGAFALVYLVYSRVFPTVAVPEKAH